MLAEYFENLEGFGGFVKGFFTVILIIRIGYIIFYLLNAYPLYKMGKRAGYPRSWFAWLPVFSNYLLCMLPRKKFSLFGGKIVIKDRVVSFYLFYLLQIMPQVGGFLVSIFIPGTGFILAVLLMLFSIPTYFINYVWTRDIYEAYRPGEGFSSKVLAFFSILFPVVKWVMLSLIYKNEPYYGLGMYPYAQEYDPDAK